ncbi:MAG TPA: tetratricopeptide repeat protein, partial [Gemmataceae bacterium]
YLVAHELSEDEARRDLAYARELAENLGPADAAEVYLASADLAEPLGEGEKARGYLEEGLKRSAGSPEEYRFYLALATMDARAGDRAGAAAKLAKALELAGNNFGVVWSVADARIDLAETEREREDVGRLIERIERAGATPEAVDYLRGRLRMAAGEYAAAIPLLERSRAGFARQADMAVRADLLLASCYERVGDPGQRVAVCERAKKTDPASVRVRMALAEAYVAAARSPEDILRGMREYRELTPREPAARLALARLELFRNLRRKAAERDWSDFDDLMRGAPEEARRSATYRILEAEATLAKNPGDPAAREEVRKTLRGFATAPGESQADRTLYWVALAEVTAGGPEPDPHAGLGVLDEAGGKAPPGVDLPSAVGALAGGGGGAAVAKVADGVELRLGRARLLALRPGAGAVAELDRLAQGLDRFPVEEQNRLLRGLVGAYSRAGAPEKAEEILADLATVRMRQDLQVQLLYFDRLAAKGEGADLEALERARDRLYAIEGDEGVLWRFAEGVRHVLIDRREPGGGHLDTALAALAEVEKRRPSWSRALLLEAEILDRQGKVEEAIRKYDAAFEAGERAPRTAARLAELYNRTGRPDEALRFLARVQGRADSLPPELARVAAQATLLGRGAGEDRAEELREAAARFDPKSKDHWDWIVRGQCFAAAWELCRTAAESEADPAKRAALNGEAEEARRQAEGSFARALELKGSAPECWEALVAFLVRSGRAAEAKAELAKAERLLKGHARSRALAFAYEALGDREAAAKHFAELVRLSPDPLAARQQEVQFYLRGGDMEKAEPLLRVLAAAGGEGRSSPSFWARRTLALARASRGGYAGAVEALELVEQNLRRDPRSPEDLRVKALVRASMPGGRGDSIQALTESFRQSPAKPEEKFLLARLYEMNGEWREARGHYLDLLQGEGRSNRTYLAHFVRGLLHNDETAQAAQWLGVLRGVAAGDPVTLELTARLHSQRVRELSQRTDDPAAAREATEAAAELEAAVAALKDYAEKAYAADPAKNNPQVFLATGRLLEELNRFAEAEELLKRYVRLSQEGGPKEAGQGNPAAPVVLALFYARRDRVPEALTLCEGLLRVRDKRLPEPKLSELVARVGVAVLRLGKPGRGDFDRVEGWVEQAIRRHPDSVDLRLSKADLSDARGEYAEAIRLYREVLRDKVTQKDGAGRELALNNLAWLLALHAKDPAAARAHIDQAVKASGPKGALLDTRGVVLLAQGEPLRAVEDLLKSVAEAEQPHRYFHLAQAYLAAGEQDEARRALHKA